MFPRLRSELLRDVKVTLSSSDSEQNMETSVLSAADLGSSRLFEGRRAQLALAVLVLASHMPLSVRRRIVRRWQTDTRGE